MNKLFKIIIAIMVLSLMSCITEPTPTDVTEIDDGLPPLPDEISSSSIDGLDGISSSSIDVYSSSSSDSIIDWASKLGTVMVFNDTQYVYDEVVGRLNRVINNPCSNIDTVWSVNMPEYVVNYVDSLSDYKDSIGQIYNGPDYISTYRTDMTTYKVIQCKVLGYENVIIEALKPTPWEPTLGYISITQPIASNIIINNEPLLDVINPTLDSLLVKRFETTTPGFYPCTSSKFCTL